MLGLKRDTVKAFIFSEHEPGQTKQIKDPFRELIEMGVALKPPYDPQVWGELLEKNTRLNRAIHCVARNTVGLGWEIVPVKPRLVRESPEVRREFEREKEMLEEFLSAPNPQLPLSETLFLMKIDEEATGNGYLEITRNFKGIPDGIYHVPSHTIRILRGGEGFVQIRGGRRRFFKNFGDKRIMDMETGRFTEEAIPLEQRANEIIHFKVYSPRDPFYGIPRYVAASFCISGNRMAAERNLAFFRNDAVGRLAVLVSGGQLDSKSIESIERFINTKGRGPQNAHRVMVLQSEARKIPYAGEAKTKIEIVPLTVGVSDDASFIKYREANDEEIREAFGLASLFLGSGDRINRATAIILRGLVNEQEFLPEIRAKEYRINNTIIRAMGVKHAKFELIRPKSTDYLQDSQIIKNIKGTGALTPNDVRAWVSRALELDLEPFPEEEEAQIAKQVNSRPIIETEIPELFEEQELRHLKAIK